MVMFSGAPAEHESACVVVVDAVLVGVVGVGVDGVLLFWPSRAHHPSRNPNFYDGVVAVIVVVGVIAPHCMHHRVRFLS
jgi:hypothetical protein